MHRAITRWSYLLKVNIVPGEAILLITLLGRNPIRSRAQALAQLRMNTLTLISTRFSLVLCFILAAPDVELIPSLTLTDDPIRRRLDQLASGAKSPVEWH